MQTRWMIIAALGLSACMARTIRVHEDEAADAYSPGTEGVTTGPATATGGQATQTGTTATGGADIVASGAGGAGQGGSMADASSGSTTQVNPEGGGTTVPLAEASGGRRVEPDAAGCIANSVMQSSTWIADNPTTGPTPIVLTVQGASEGGGVCGTITFGNGTPPDPPTDPNIGWPPSLRDSVERDQFFGDFNPMSGYAYPLVSRGVAATRILFSINNYAPWDAWCAMQTPYPLPGGDTYQCTPWAHSSTTLRGSCAVDSAPIDCTKLNMCLAGQPVYRCQCDASGCSAYEYVSSFDITLGQTHAIGTYTAGSEGKPIQFARVVNDD